MCDKPMTEYLNYKYPTDEAVHQTTASLLEKINSMVKQIKQLQSESDDLKAELNNIGEYLCDTSRCKRRYRGVKGLDGEA